MPLEYVENVGFLSKVPHDRSWRMSCHDQRRNQRKSGINTLLRMLANQAAGAVAIAGCSGNSSGCDNGSSFKRLPHGGGRARHSVDRWAPSSRYGAAARTWRLRCGNSPSDVAEMSFSLTASAAIASGGSG